MRFPPSLDIRDEVTIEPWLKTVKSGKAERCPRRVGVFSFIKRANGDFDTCIRISMPGPIRSRAAAACPS